MESGILGWDEDDDMPIMHDSCPQCGEVYDDIDYEYQICSDCGFNNNPGSDVDFDEESEDNNPNDSRNL